MAQKSVSPSDFLKQLKVPAPLRPTLTPLAAVALDGRATGTQMRRVMGRATKDLNSSHAGHLQELGLNADQLVHTVVNGADARREQIAV